MTQNWKRIFRSTIILLFIIGGLLVSINTYFADDIEKNIISKMQEKMEAPLILDDVEFSLYHNFPYASLKITNLLIIESVGFNHDTLLFAKSAYIEISILDLINKIYDVQSIIVADAEINIKYNDLQNPNFLVLKKDTSNITPVSINKITLLNTKLKIQKMTPILDLNWFIERSIISINNQKYGFTTNGFSNKLVVGVTDYMHTKKFNFNAKTQIKKDTISILKSNLNIEDLFLRVQGNINQGNTLDLDVDIEKQKINQLIINLPENIQKLCSGFILQGEITLHSSLKGLINKENNPSLEMQYEVAEGEFKLQSAPFELSNMKITGSVTNGEYRNFSSTKIIANLFEAKTNDGNINGEMTLTNLNNYFLDGQFKSSWNLTEVSGYFEKSPFIGLTGKLFASTNYTGNISFNSRFKKMFLNANHTSDITLENITFNHTISPLNFTVKSMSCKLKNHTLIVDRCRSTISETDFNFNGKIINLIPYMLEDGNKIYVDGNIKSTYANLSELITLGNNSKEEDKENIMPNWLDVNMDINIKNLSYKKFIASKVKGDITYKNKALYSKKIDANSLNGEIACDFILTEPISNNLKLKSSIQLKQINIRNSFDAFNNYGQKFITQEQLKGVGTAEIEFESHWQPNFLLDTKKLQITSHLIIEKGELIDFKPLEKLSSYVSIEELKHVKFSTLENTINVENEIITIPKMEIKSSALSVFLSGEHSFNQEINYEITLLLSELLSSSFRSENTKITEFGEEKKDGEIFNTIYFKMTGNTESPKISLDKIRFMEDLKNNITKEKDIINTIIKQDVLQKEEKDIIESGEDIEIEWNPEL